MYIVIQSIIMLGSSATMEHQLQTSRILRANCDGHCIWYVFDASTFLSCLVEQSIVLKFRAYSLKLRRFKVIDSIIPALNVLHANEVIK